MTDLFDGINLPTKPLVHYAGVPWETGDHAACGEKIKRSRGLDFNTTWNPNAPLPVTCEACLKHRPKRKMIRTWENGSGKRGR